jgi:hypothetical protein
MLDCVKKAQNGENIDNNTDCIAVFKYEKQRCEMKHHEGALWYLQYDCNDKLEMGKLAIMGM